MKWMVYGHFLLFILYILFIKCKRINAKLGKYIFWNGSIRLYIEVYFEISLLSLLNINHIENNEYFTDFESSSYSNILSIIYASTIVSIPVFLMMFIWFKMSKWQDKIFQMKYGSFIAGSNL